MPPLSAAAPRGAAVYPRVLTLAFLRPVPGEDRMNDLTARAGEHGMCHAELVFEGGLGFSIQYAEPTRMRQRTFSNPGYEMVSLSVSHMEYSACAQFCSRAVKEAYPFDSWGMYLATVHPGGCSDRPSSAVGRTFCSKIITEALQFAEVPEVAHLSPSAVTPSRLYAAVKDSERRVCHSVRPLQLVKSGGGSVVAQMTMNR